MTSTNEDEPIQTAVFNLNFQCKGIICEQYQIKGSLSRIDQDLYHFTWTYVNDCKDVYMSRSELVEFIANLQDFSECFVIRIEGEFVNHRLMSSEEVGG
jgi:hypothetical protein